MLTLQQKLDNQAAAKALEPVLNAANATCGQLGPGAPSDDALKAFCIAVEAMRARYAALHGYRADSMGTISFERLRKNIRVQVAAAQTSVFCFVDPDTGAILKAAGWKVPAKGVRGSIYNGAADCTPHGAVYNR